MPTTLKLILCTPISYCIQLRLPPNTNSTNYTAEVLAATIATALPGSKETLISPQLSTWVTPPQLQPFTFTTPKLQNNAFTPLEITETPIPTHDVHFQMYPTLPQTLSKPLLSIPPGNNQNRTFSPFLRRG